MLTPLPNITYDVQEAIDYYNILKKDFSDLIWTKQEMTEYSTIDISRKSDILESFFNTVGKREPFNSWDDDKVLEFVYKKRWDYIGKAKAWNIKVSGEEGFHVKVERQHELQFGFAQKIIDAFPDISMLQLVINPVGTKYHRHVDTADIIRVIIPIISDEGAVWHFDGAENLTHLPGHAYVAQTEFPHATDVHGPEDRVSFMFLLPIDKFEWVTNYKCKI